MMTEFKHVSVLLDECIDNLKIDPDGIYVDGTLGLGGHSAEIAKRLRSGRLICIDRDETAIERAGARLEAFADRITFVHGNFSLRFSTRLGSTRWTECCLIWEYPRRSLTSLSEAFLISTTRR